MVNSKTRLIGLVITVEQGLTTVVAVITSCLQFSLRHAESIPNAQSHEAKEFASCRVFLVGKAQQRVGFSATRSRHCPASLFQY